MATQTGLNGANVAMDGTDGKTRDTAGGARLRRYLPLAVVAIGLALSYYFGLQDYLSLERFWPRSAMRSTPWWPRTGCGRP